MSLTSDDGPLFFWQHYEHPYGFLSQWYPCAFTAPSPSPADPPMTFLTTEQYHKARLFDDTEIAEQIMVETEPRKQQALGRQVKNFSKRVWEANKERIVEEGNWNKFSNPKEEADLGEKLIETGERELVEASPSDRIWGVGFDAENAEKNRHQWGQNLLGKAIMRARGRVREQKGSS
ncbi:hypothetical protein MMC24_001001 [Lignoscripta atroalba]|nr:hypothetical protein [Lignoscripta atroalba]